MSLSPKEREEKPLARMTERAEEIQAQSQYRLTFEQAFLRAVSENPARYERYVDARSEQISRSGHGSNSTPPSLLPNRGIKL